MPRIRLLTSVAGKPGWTAGDEVDVDTATAEAWADGVRAVPVEPVTKGETHEARPHGEKRRTHRK